MPTNKPKIQAILEPEIYTKYKEICKKESRSESNMGKKIITEYVQNYEKKDNILKPFA